MRKTRIAVQIILFLVFIGVLITHVYPLKKGIPNVFLEMSPLYSTLLLIWKSFKWAFIGGFVVLILTLFLGRFFCGWMCPLGITLDFASKIFGGGANTKDKKNFSYIKYIILVFILVSALLNVSNVHFFGPQSLIYRFYTFVVFPVANKGWEMIREHIPFAKNFHLSYVQISYRWAIGYFFIFLIIFLLEKYQRRFWCRNICPLGAILGIFSRFSLIQKKVSSECINCGKCTRECKMGAIPQDPTKFKVTECIYCFNCVKDCPTQAISFEISSPLALGNLKEEFLAFVKGKQPPSKETSSGFSRRHFIEGAILAGAIVSLSKTDFNISHKYERLIRPPAALPEEEFNNVCIRCGECMKVCISGGLQPTLLEGGYSAIMTPRLIPEAGQCEFYCNMCQKVCPTGAIQPFLIEEKPHIKMGTARINRSYCLAWYKDEYCLVCDEHCPVKAIYWKEIDGRLRPFVDEAICIGCGYCENKCPVKPQSAIKVFSQGEFRHKLKKGESWAKVHPIPQNTPSTKYDGRSPENMEEEYP